MLQVNPWENGFPQGSQQGGPADQLSLAGNLLGQILGRTAGVGGVGANLATSLVMASVMTFSHRLRVLGLARKGDPFIVKWRMLIVFILSFRAAMSNSIFVFATFYLTW